MPPKLTKSETSLTFTINENFVLTIKIVNSKFNQLHITTYNYGGNKNFTLDSESEIKGLITVLFNMAPKLGIELNGSALEKQIEEAIDVGRLVDLK